MKIVWLPQAQFTRFVQLDYIAQDNPLAAIAQDEEIERQVDALHTPLNWGEPDGCKGRASW